MRDESPDPAVIEAAAARVWTRVAEAAHAGDHEHIRGCDDFRALIPDYRAGKLSGPRALLLKDHLHECVACRRVFEGRVVTMPAARTPRPVNYTVRWAAAAAVVFASGFAIWFAIDQYGPRGGRAYVQTLNGTLYAVAADGLHPLASGQDLPDGVEFRTAKDSDAMLQLRDGSVVELRERSSFSTAQAGSDLTVRLGRGSVIVQAAKRRQGHLYVATADCRVAVTGTVFSVSAGVKGSRVSVIEGEVHVTQENQEKVLHPGDQTVTSPAIEPLAIPDDIAWSRNRDRLLQQLASLKAGLQQLHLPNLRYSSKLLDRLPANTVLFASIPNLAGYLGEAQSVFHEKLAESPELRAFLAGRMNLDPVLDKLRAAGGYLGDEVVIAAFPGADGHPQAPALLAETQREGFADFLKQQGLPLAIVMRGNLAVFGPDKATVDALAASLDAPAGGFVGTPFYQRIAQSYRNGVGLLLCADIGAMHQQMMPGAHYFIAEQKEVASQMEARATLAFDGPRTGMAAWLAPPAAMGSLDYITPEAVFAAAFVVSSPAAIIDQVLAVQQRSPEAAEKALADVKAQTGIDIRNDLAASLGGEFAVALDGPALPVPSWKLVAEVYDPGRFQASLQKLVEASKAQASKTGEKSLRSEQETVEGRTYYTIASSQPNPLMEAHYTFADGYLIAAPTRALVTRALQTRSAGASLPRSTAFMAMVPRDHYANFSAVIYQNLGTTLAPIISLFGGMAPKRAGEANPLQALGNMKPSLFAAYGEPDRLTVATSGDAFGLGLTSIMHGSLLDMTRGAVPFSAPRELHGTRSR
ncbi:MAG TPA: FecR domain-containing protein [Bryobacteraceae bacterium]